MEIVSLMQESLGKMLSGRCRKISNTVGGEVIGMRLRTGGEKQSDSPGSPAVAVATEETLENQATLA
jgi:hypothetical protein